jgi:hypothetical protein
LLLAFAACALHAQEDPLKSTACGNALAALQAARSAKDSAARIASLRGAAAQTCLGSSAVPTRPARVVQAPVHVPPPQIEVPMATPSLPAAIAPPPPVAIERYPQPAVCDANGCWSNDGSHLRLVPPNLPGPGGLCTTQGGLVYCP